MPELDNPEIFRAVLDSLQTGIYFVDPSKRILFWNEGAEKITGYLRHEAIGCFCTENPEQGKRSLFPETSEALAAALRDGKPGIETISLGHRAGHRIYVRVRTVPIRNSHGTIIAAAQSLEENPSESEWDRRHDKLAGYGALDAVSGVLNKNVILSHLREHLTTFSQHAVPFSVLCMEVDQLERLRASYGVAVLGPVLQVMAHTVENSLRPTDFVGRIAENRFLAILNECSLPDIERAAKRLKKAVTAAQIEWWGDQWTISASFGGAAARMGDTIESLLDRAEKSLVESLAAGGNQVTVAA